MLLITLRVGGSVLKMRFAISWAGGAATNQVFRKFPDGRIGVLQRGKKLIIGGHMGILSPFQVAEEQVEWVTILHFSGALVNR